MRGPVSLHWSRPTHRLDLTDRKFTVSSTQVMPAERSIWSKCEQEAGREIVGSASGTRTLLQGQWSIVPVLSRGISLNTANESQKLCNCRKTPDYPMNGHCSASGNTLYQSSDRSYIQKTASLTRLTWNQLNWERIKYHLTMSIELGKLMFYVPVEP